MPENMNEYEMIREVQQMVGDCIDQPTVIVYLKHAYDAIRRRLYPFNTEMTDITGYENLQVELAVRYILRRGGQGEISHSEGGVTHTYASVNDEDLLSVITPYMEVR